MIQLRLFSSDHAALKSIFGKTIGVNQAIRTIIRTYVRSVKADSDKIIDLMESGGS